MCVFGVAIDGISVCLKLEIASDVFPDWREVNFWRRPGSDEPNTQMFEDSPDHLAVIYRNNDPQDTLTFRTDQWIDLPGLLRDRLLFSESVLSSFSGRSFHPFAVRGCTGRRHQCHATYHDVCRTVAVAGVPFLL